MTDDVKTHGVLAGQTWHTAGGDLVYVIQIGPIVAEVKRARDNFTYVVVRRNGRYTAPVDAHYKRRVEALPLEIYVRGPSMQNHTAVPTEEEDEAWREREARMDVVGQNGNDGDHYPPGAVHVEAQSAASSLPQFSAYGSDALRGSLTGTATLREHGKKYEAYEAELAKTNQGIAGGMKWDKDKPRMDLLLTGMPRALEAVGQVLTFGAEKYSAHSWQKVENAEDRYYAAQIRHQVAAGKGDAYDPETHLLHLAHEACNVLFRLELALQGQPKGES